MLKRFSKSGVEKYAKSIVLSLGLLSTHACSMLPQQPQSDERLNKATEEARSANTASATKSELPTKIEVSPAVQKRYAQALELMKAEQYEQAIDILREVARSNENLSGPYVNLGIIYLKTGKMPEAEQASKRAIEINPHNPAAHNLLGMLQRQNGLFNEAEQSYQSALATYPDYLHAHLNLGILCDLYLHNIDCALRHYAKYLQLSGDEDKQVSKWLVDLRKRSETKTQ